MAEFCLVLKNRDSNWNPGEELYFIGIVCTTGIRLSSFNRSLVSHLLTLLLDGGLGVHLEK
jgi:hypothetical protein